MERWLYHCNFCETGYTVNKETIASIHIRDKLAEMIINDVEERDVRLSRSLVIAATNGIPIYHYCECPTSIKISRDWLPTILTVERPELILWQPL